MESRKRRWDNSQPVLGAPPSSKRAAGVGGTQPPPAADGGGPRHHAPGGNAPPHDGPPSDRRGGRGGGGDVGHHHPAGPNTQQPRPDGAGNAPPAPHFDRPPPHPPGGPWGGGGGREYTVPLKGGAGGNNGGGGWQSHPRPQDPSPRGGRGRWDNSIASDFEAAMGGYDAGGMYPPPPPAMFPVPPAGMPPPQFERPPAFPPPPAGGPPSMPPPQAAAGPEMTAGPGGGADDAGPRGAAPGNGRGGGGGPDDAAPAPRSSSRPQNRSSTPPPDRVDYEYTRSLHWASSDVPEKRPIDLPGDVEHITDVEWADETSSTHESSVGETCHAVGGRSSLQSSIASLAKACKPRMVRPEPCFCEPNLETQEMCCTNTDCALFASQEECPTNCPCGPLCGNKRIQRRQWKRLSVFDAGLKGRGLMVNEDCERGDFIVEYTGVAVQKKFLDSLFRKYKSERMLYIMALDNDVYIDARFRGGIARYINHSCNPNCIVHRWKVKGISRACVFALRDIKEGEELSFDYQWERKRGRAFTKCHCGSSNCRGTIESSEEGDDDLANEIDGHWIEPRKGGLAGREIMNRVIKVWFEESDEWYVADIAQFDHENGKHLVMYRGGENEEYWTDLTKERWMLLDEEGERFAIARKPRVQRDAPPGAVAAPAAGAEGSSAGTSPRSDSRSSSPVPPGGAQAKVRNCIYIQTPVKDAMQTRHTLFKCSSHCRVHIDLVNLPVRDVKTKDGAATADDGEVDEELTRAVSQSKDGMLWKVVVSGMDVRKAVDWLQKMEQRITNDLSADAASAPGTLLNHGGVSAKPIQTEIILPRIVVDEVKRRFFTMKGYCYNVDVTFTHSDSKSKQFAKLSLGAGTIGEMERALDYLYGELSSMCLAARAPMTNMGVYTNLGFLGGELSHEDYRLLFYDDETKLSRSAATSSKPKNECTEDLDSSTFAVAFQQLNRCSIWVQSEQDMGRVLNNRVINESSPHKPRRIYFGVNPNRVSQLWGFLTSRVADLKRGVRFLHLDKDRIYQPSLLEPIRKNGNKSGCNYFFDFVRQTTGASVSIDSITNCHLRIDGGDITKNKRHADFEVDDKVELAEELIWLQVELLRDHHIRKQRWGFGRDWALLLDDDFSSKRRGAAVSNDDDSTVATGTSVSKLTSTAEALRLSDNRAVGTACLEMSEIVNSAGLSEKVAAHACIIFYRYINLNDPATINSNFKLRDIQLATLFIANKAQKVTKWKRLDTVLEHAYKIFYPGSLFNPDSEEAKNWERRVIKAEMSVLTALQYDVFWPGVDWVINAVAGTKAMAEPLAENTMGLALSGHVLAAGPVLWLKYGPKYAFAAVAGFLQIDIEPLFRALSLQPLTVSHAAELIYNSCQALSKVKRSVSHQSKCHELFSDSKLKQMSSNIQLVQKDCANYISKNQGQTIDDSKFVSSPAYKEVSERAKLRRVFRGVQSEPVQEKILPALSKITFESKCTIRFSDGALEGTNDIVLEGNWKSLAIAVELLCYIVPDLPTPVPFEQSTATNAMLYSALSGVNSHRETRPAREGPIIKQVKTEPGLMDIAEIDGKHGWYGTFESSDNCDAGWKTCVAASAPQEHLNAAGLRWWVPNQYGPSMSGSICEIFSNPRILDRSESSGGGNTTAIALLAQSFFGSQSYFETKYPSLAACLHSSSDDPEKGRNIALSLQRWPAEKTAAKEKATTKDDKMEMGYSVAALQEMQLLHQLHFLIPSPQGHPNFVLPLAIALDSDADNSKGEKPSEEGPASAIGSSSNRSAETDILVMLERNKSQVSGKKQITHGSHLVLEPTPINLQKVMSRYQRKSGGGKILPPNVLASWCHDILSAISFCHSNHIVLRSMLPDQIYLDHSGTAKLSGLSKIMVLHGKDRTKDFNPLKFVRSKKGKGKSSDDVEPFAAPELLLGGTRHTKETDMWAFGALTANLLLGKQLFPGKDRVSKMTQVFKIVGVPDKGNYEHAKRFPYYSRNMHVIGDGGKKKKYVRGVEKALRHMVKSFESDAQEDFAGLTNLLDGLLHLDPKKRMSADEALRHPYFMNHLAQVELKEYRENYVKDWLDLKENVLTKGKSPVSTLKETLANGESKSKKNGEGEETPKGRAFLFDTSTLDGDGDELYNLDDLLGGSAKRPKYADD